MTTLKKEVIVDEKVTCTASERIRSVRFITAVGGWKTAGSSACQWLCHAAGHFRLAALRELKLAGAPSQSHKKWHSG